MAVNRELAGVAILIDQILRELAETHEQILQLRTILERILLDLEALKKLRR